jgi:hypothetical protein
MNRIGEKCWCGALRCTQSTLRFGCCDGWCVLNTACISHVVRFVVLRAPYGVDV